MFNNNYKIANGNQFNNSGGFNWGQQGSQFNQYQYQLGSNGNNPVNSGTLRFVQNNRFTFGGKGVGKIPSMKNNSRVKEIDSSSENSESESESGSKYNPSESVDSVQKGFNR